MHISKSPKTPQEHFSEYIKNIGSKKYQMGGPTSHEGGGRALSPWARPLPRERPVGSTDVNSNYIYILVLGEKYQREGFVAFYDTEPPPPPVLYREGRFGVRSGLRRGGFIAIIIINHPPSLIS